jgi:cell division transport system permease protein
LATQEGRAVKRKRPSYLPSIISISLVLYLLGLFGLMLIYAKNLSDYLRESIQLDVYFVSATPEAEILKVQKTIDSREYVKSSLYISKEKAARDYAQELGEDFIAVIGDNPILSSVEINLRSDYAESDSITRIEKDLMGMHGVAEVVYQKSLPELLNRNKRIIGIILLSLSAVLMVISITLINNTIRLNLFARRFIIKSMQLVGATQWFIIKPFMFKSILHGIYGGLIAVLLLTGTVYVLLDTFPDMVILQNYRYTGIMFGILVVLGVFITLLSSFAITRKYLKLKIDDLY